MAAKKSSTAKAPTGTTTVVLRAEDIEAVRAYADANWPGAPVSVSATVRAIIHASL